MAISKGSVKGSVHTELVVRPHDPGKAVFKRVLYGISLVVVAFGCFALGYFGSLSHIESLSIERDELALNLSRSKEEISDLTRRVGVLSKGEEISRQAANSVRGTILELETEVADLKQEVSFYKNIMVPGEDGATFRIDRVKLVDGGDGSVHFSLVLSQPGNTRSTVKGLLSMSLTASQVDGVVDIPLHEISDTIEPAGIPFRFRYFQEVDGVIRVPEGVTPQRLHLTAVTSGKKSQRIEETIDWSL